jgi:hypothetical protein
MRGCLPRRLQRWRRGFCFSDEACHLEGFLGWVRRARPLDAPAPSDPGHLAPRLVISRRPARRTSRRAGVRGRRKDKMAWRRN